MSSTNKPKMIIWGSSSSYDGGWVYCNICGAKQHGSIDLISFSSPIPVDLYKKFLLSSSTKAMIEGEIYQVCDECRKKVDGIL